MNNKVLLVVAFLFQCFHVDENSKKKLMQKK